MSEYITIVSEDVEQKLEDTFSPLGIAAYSNCCRFGCTGTYADETGWKVKQPGIYDIKIYLSGMNFREEVRSVFCYYEEFDFLTKNWEDEKGYLDLWARSLGIPKDCYTIIKPSTPQKAVEIQFSTPLRIIPPYYSDDEE